MEAGFDFCYRGLPAPHSWICGCHSSDHLRHLHLHLFNLLQEHQDAPLQSEKPQTQHPQWQCSSQWLGPAISYDQIVIAVRL